MERQKIITRLFDYFHNKIHKSNFHLDLSVNNQQKQVDNFIKLLAVYYPGLSGVGVNFLIQYFSFAFSIYADKKLKRNISLNWIIGKKTFLKWFEQDRGHKYYVDKFLLEHNVNLDDLRQSLIEVDVSHDVLDRTEELEKLRFHGEARLYNCISHTTMYNHRSVNCLSCEMKSACKGILKNNNPRLYKRRGYV